MKLTKIAERNEKKLDISEFFEKGDFITLLKIPYSAKKKIDIMSMHTMTGKTGQAMYKALKKKGIDPRNMQGMTQDDQLDLMMGLDISATEDLNKMTMDVFKMFLEYGVHPEKHSFVDQDDKPVKLDFDVWDLNMPKEFIEFAVNQVKAFNEGILPGEPKGEKSEA